MTQVRENYATTRERTRPAAANKSIGAQQTQHTTVFAPIHPPLIHLDVSPNGLTLNSFFGDRRLRGSPTAYSFSPPYRPSLDSSQLAVIG